MASLGVSVEATRVHAASPIPATPPREDLPRETISIPARKVALALAAVTLVLGLLSVVAGVESLATIDDPFLSEVRESFVRLFLLDLEQNVPTWYSSVLLLSCAFLLAIIASVHSRRRGTHVPHWVLLSLVFAYLSLDEAVELHEMSIKPLRSILGATGFFYFAWVIPGALGVAILALAYLGFLRALPRRTRRLFVLAAVVYVGGALVVESASAMEASLHGERDLAYQAISTLEELLEMAGVIVFFYGLLDYIQRELKQVSFDVVAD